MSAFELEAKLFYSAVVAGKCATFANQCVARWLENVWSEETPFLTAARLDLDGSLEASLRKARTGNYQKLIRVLRIAMLKKIDLSMVSPGELETIPGIGPKTSRFFVVWTRPEERHAVLDVHILRWLAGKGYDVPVHTPSKKRYAEIEQMFLGEADKAGKTPRELDFEIWSRSASAKNVVAAFAANHERRFS